MTKRTRNQKRKELARKKAAYSAWVPRCHNKAGIIFPTTFVDLARELRDMVYDNVLLKSAGHKIPISPDWPSASRAEAEVLRASVQSSRVSKQFHVEAEETLYQRNAFSIEPASFEDRRNYGHLAPDPSCMVVECKLLRGMTESVIPELRTITIYDRIFWWVQRFHSRLRSSRQRGHRKEARSAYTLRLQRPTDVETAVEVKHKVGLQGWKSELYRLQGLLKGWREELIPEKEVALLEAIVPLEENLQGWVDVQGKDDGGFWGLWLGLLEKIALAGRTMKRLVWRDPASFRPFDEDALESVYELGGRRARSNVVLWYWTALEISRLPGEARSLCRCMFRESGETGW